MTAGWVAISAEAIEKVTPMNRFARFFALVGLVLAVTSCSSSADVRNTSMDECCHFVLADPSVLDSRTGDELELCDNNGRNDLVDGNEKNDQKGLHLCGPEAPGGADGDGDGGSAGSTPDTSVTVPAPVPDSTVPAAETTVTTDPAVPGPGESTSTTEAPALIDNAVVRILPVSDVYEAVESGSGSAGQPVPAVVTPDVTTIVVSPDQIAALIEESGVPGGRVFVQPVVTEPGFTLGLTREAIAGEWREVSAEEGMSLRIGSGAPTIRFQVRPADGSEDGAVAVAVDVRRTDGSGEGTGSGAVTTSFNWWWLLVLAAVAAALEAERRRRAKRASA